MLNLTDIQLEEINECFQWTIKQKLPNGQFLGNGKKLKIKLNKDLQLFFNTFKNLKKAKILEVGCAGGFNTIKLAQLCKLVIGLDVRPKNLISTMINAWVHNLKNIEYILYDLNKENLNFNLPNFNIIYHTGVLYHLSDPIKHLKQLRKFNVPIFLSTRCYKEKHNIKNFVGLANQQNYNYKLYRVNETTNYYENATSGINSYSIYLHHKEIPIILNDIGFKNIKLMYETNDDRPRVIYTAK